MYGDEYQWRKSTSHMGLHIHVFENIAKIFDQFSLIIISGSDKKGRTEAYKGRESHMRTIE